MGGREKENLRTEGWKGREGGREAGGGRGWKSCKGDGKEKIKRKK